MQGVKTLLTAIGLLLLVGVAVTPARAQAVHVGKVTGAVISEDGVALPGATVELSGTGLVGGALSTTTSSRGMYAFLNLPLGTYTVKASRDAFKTVLRENVEVSPAAVTTVDFTLPVGGMEEVVTVTANASIVDTKTSTIDAKIDRALLAKLPTSRDAFYDLALSTPGMFTGSGAPSQTTEFQSPTAYGSATNENVFLIDGVDSTNPRAGSFGSLVNVNYDTVEEVRIVALGSKAEYGSYSGAAIDVLTKSGSNQYHGSGAFYSKLGSVADNQPAAGYNYGTDYLYVGEDENPTGEVKKDWEGSGTFGGPIILDKLWFFGAFDYKRGATLPPLQTVESESWGRYIDAKITSAPFTNHRATLSYHWEDNDGTGWSWGTPPGWDTTMTYGSGEKNNTVSAQWQWLAGPKTTLSAKWLGFWTDQNPTLPDNAPANPGYINWWKWTDAYGSYGVGGAFPYVEGYNSSRSTIQGDVSHYAEGFLGENDIKFGVQYTKGRSDSKGGYFQGYVNFLYPYRWTQSVQYMQSWYGDTGLLFNNYRNTINPFLTARTADSLGVFFDDQWTPTRRLTINLGLRFDQMTSKYGVGKVYEPPPPGGSFTDLTVLRDRAGTDNVFDFKTWSPRLGLTYQLTSDGKTVARASYGRYYMPLTVEYLRRFGPDMPPQNTLFEVYYAGPWSVVDENGDGFIDSLEVLDAARMIPGQTPLWTDDWGDQDTSWTLNVADNLKDQHTDQVTVNLEREIGDNLALGGTYIYKHTTDTFANIPINRETGEQWQYEFKPYTTSQGVPLMLYSIVQQDYDGNGVIDGDDIQWIGNHNTSLVQNTPPFGGVTPKRDYHAFQLMLRKSYSSRWQGLVSLVYSTSDGMSRRSFRQDFNVEGPMFYDDNWMGNLNYGVNNLDGPLPFTPKWEFKLNAIYTIPRIEVDFGARLRLVDGRAIWRIDNYPVITASGGPPDGVINPGGLPQVLAVDPNEPDYLPALKDLDIHIEKTFKLGGTRSINFIVDGFNIFNSNPAINASVVGDGYGRVTNIPLGRRFRFGARYEF
jgi:hypothetical protein